MGEMSDKAKGRVKQAAGDLTDDDELHMEGKKDETAGKAKEVLNDLKEKAEAAVDEIKDRVDARRDKS